ncbi:MAG: hypothetical protein ACOX83_02685 [Candidatus Spyradocola sp.]|jgi:hypothetical protein
MKECAKVSHRFVQGGPAPGPAFLQKWIEALRAQAREEKTPPSRADRAAQGEQR